MMLPAMIFLYARNNFSENWYVILASIGVFVLFSIIFFVAQFDFLSSVRRRLVFFGVSIMNVLVLLVADRPEILSQSLGLKVPNWSAMFIILFSVSLAAATVLVFFGSNDNN